LEGVDALESGGGDFSSADVGAGVGCCEAFDAKLAMHFDV
jgi:hypothetical protein